MAKKTTRHYVSATHKEEAQCCDHGHQGEEEAPGEAKFQCGCGCCEEDPDSSSVYVCEDYFCGQNEGHDTKKETVDKEELRVTYYRAVRFSRIGLGRPSSCNPATNGDGGTRTTGKCVPDGANGCLRAAWFKSTCCSLRGNSTLTSYPPPGFPTDSSDSILLKEFNSIIQDHSTHHYHSELCQRTVTDTLTHGGRTHHDGTPNHHPQHSRSHRRTTSATLAACSVVHSLFTRVLRRLTVSAKGECCCVANQTVVPIPICFPPCSHPHTHEVKHSLSQEPHTHVRSPSITPLEIIQTSIELAERGAGVERRRMIMSIEGMDCPSCAVRVTKALNTIPSVTHSKVNAFAAEATLMYDTGAICSDEIAQRVTGLTGFICKSEKELGEGDLLKTLWVSVPVKPDGSKLPTGVSIKSRKLTKKKEHLLEVQYDSTVIQPRGVVAAFKPWGGEFVPLEQAREPNLASKELWYFLRRTALSAIATIPILVFSWAPLPKHPILYDSISLALATFVQFYIAFPLYQTSFRSLFFQRIMDMDLLVAGSTSIAYIYSIVSFGFLVAGKPIDKSFFETSALLVTLIMVGSSISAFATRRTTSALDAVSALQVRMVNLVEGDDVRSIHAELVHVGDVLQVSPDSAIPTDGVIRSGFTQVDESSLTGESKPAEKQKGSPVLAGTLNLSGSIEITASRSLSENTIAGISRLMHDAQESRIPIQDLVDKFANYFAPAVLVLGLVTLVAWILIGKFVEGKTVEKACIGALMKVIAVFVVSCPCAVSMCVPMVAVIAVSVAAKKGILFKSIGPIQYARATNAVLFDKTGTLTEGNLSVVEFYPLADDAALLAYRLTETSTHPVAKAVNEYSHSLVSSSTVPQELGTIKSIVGQGLETKLGQRTLRGGNCRWLNLGQHPKVRELRRKPRTIFAVTLDGEPVAIFGLADKVKPGAEELVRWLAQRGVDVYLLSGDEPTVVEFIATQLGIPPDRAIGECTPKSKADFVRNVQTRGSGSGFTRRSKRRANVMFIGDGTNDSVALTQADTGVSISSGTDVAISAADVIMLNSTNILKSVETIFRVSESAFRRIIWNFTWSFLYNSFAISLASGVFVKFSIRPEYAGLGELVSILPVILVAWTMVFI